MHGFEGPADEFVVLAVGSLTREIRGFRVVSATYGGHTDPRDTLQKV